MYSNDNHGWLVPVYMQTTALNGETISITLSHGRYVGPMKSTYMAPDVMYCPTAEMLDMPPREGWNGYKGWSGYFFGYVVNASLHGFALWGTSTLPKPVKRTTISNPSEYLELCDLSIYWAQYPGPGGAPPVSGLASGVYFDPANSAAYCLGLIHGGKAGNILHLDGSARTYQKEYLHLRSVPGQQGPW
jgi:prepilin-type processing-associated H-X9-DG protein